MLNNNLFNPSINRVLNGKDDPSRITFTIRLCFVIILLSLMNCSASQLGNIASAFSSPTFNACGGLTQEAEAGQRHGAFEVGFDGNASNAQFIHVPQGFGERTDEADETHRTTFCFNIQTSGTYRLSAWAFGAGDESNSFFVQVPSVSSEIFIWDISQNTTYQQNILRRRQDDGRDYAMNLASGQHHFHFYLREDGARLDRLKLELISSARIEPTPAPLIGHQPDPTPQPTSDLPICGDLVQEAEAGQRHGAFEIGYDNDASNGQFIYVPKGFGKRTDQADEAHKITFCFNITAPGNYQLKARSHGPTRNSDSFYVQYDTVELEAAIWDLPSSRTFVVDYVNHRDVNDAVEVNLPIGQYELTVYLREAGAKLDQIILALISDPEPEPMPEPNIEPTSEPSTPEPSIEPTVESPTPTPTTELTPEPVTESPSPPLVSDEEGGIELRDEAEQLIEKYTTIQAAIDAANPGDTIWLSTGTYHEILTIEDRSGTADKPITLAGKPGHQVIIDGAISMLQGTNTQWQSSTVASNTYLINFPYDFDYASDKAPDFYPSASFANEQLLWTYATLSDLQEYFAGPGIYLDFAQQTLYLRLEPGQDPNQVQLNIASGISVITMKNVDYWHINNLEIRHGGFALLFIRGKVQGLEIDQVQLITALNGLVVWGDAHETKISNSQFFVGRGDQWWRGKQNLEQSKTKLKSMTGAALFGRFTNAEIAHSNARGFYDGFQVFGRSLNVHHNTIHDIMDDAIELGNNAPNVDVEIHHNLIYDTHVAINLTSSRDGPVYFYRNVVVANRGNAFNPERIDRGGILLKQSSSDNHHFYHNTFYTTGQMFNQAVADGGRVPQNFHWFNNLFYSLNRTVKTAASGYNKHGNIFQGTLTFSPAQGGTGPTFGGLWGDPRFVGGISPVPDLRIASDSPARNAGDLTPLNQNWPGMAIVQDGQPDIGAFEF